MWTPDNGFFAQVGSCCCCAPSQNTFLGHLFRTTDNTIAVAMESDNRPPLEAESEGHSVLIPAGVEAGAVGSLERMPSSQMRAECSLEQDLSSPASLPPETMRVPQHHQLHRHRLPQQIHLAILSLRREEPAIVWEDLEDDLFVLLGGNEESLKVFHDLYLEISPTITRQSGISSLLRSMAYLCSAEAKDMALHDEHVSRMAAFFAVGRRDSQSLKLQVLKTMIRCWTPPEASWQIQDDVIQGTFAFMITKSMEWEYMDDHTAMALIYELRAKCIRELEMERERIQRVSDRGEEAAVLIAAGAKLVELGIQSSNKIIAGHIDNAGQRMKDWVDVEEDPLIVDRDAIVAMAFSDALKRSSEYAREGTKVAVSSLCDASISGLHKVSEKLGDEKFTERLSPEGREVMKAAGKIGVATVGAAAIVGEAIVETGREVVTKTAGVSADVVRHKYGATAGEVAKNAADTAENVFRAMGNAALMDGSIFASTVAKSAGKEQVDKDVAKVKERIQMLESNVSNLASRTLGISWRGDWTKELENSPHVSPNSTEQKRDQPDETPNQRNGLVEEDRILKSKAHVTGRKQQSHEDHSASDTSSLSSSLSTEPTSYSFAMRGKRSRRKRVPLSPDIGDLSSADSSHRRSYHTSRQLKHHGFSNRSSLQRKSWA